MYLYHDRDPLFLKTMLPTLLSWSNRRQDTELLVLCTGNPPEGVGGIEKMLVTVFPQNRNNYLQKIRFTLERGYQYIIKIDEDIFLSESILEYMFQNKELLNETVALMTPTVSTSVATCGAFLEEFLKEDRGTRSVIEQEFLDCHYPTDLWGSNYSSLNEIRNISPDYWNENLFFELVSRLSTYYKGIHPIRLSAKAQIILGLYCAKNARRLYATQPDGLREVRSPYLTNHVFMTSARWYEFALSEFPNDGYDEVPINLARESTKSKFLYLHQGFAFHPMYNIHHSTAIEGPGFSMKGKKIELEIVKEFAKNLL